MRRPSAWTLGLLSAAAAVLVTASAAAAAPQPGDAHAYATTQQRTTTLAGLNREIQEAAVRKARMRPGAPKVAAPGAGPQAGPSDEELNLICFNDWFVTWDEDSNGVAIMGTFKLYCDGQTIPVG